MTTDVANSDSHAPADSLTMKPRWWPLAAALGLGVVLQIAAWIPLAENWSYLAVATFYIIWPLTGLLLLFWWTFWSRLAWRIRCGGLVVVGAVSALLVATFRFEEFDGAMLPKFSLRWRLAAKARATEYFKSQAANSAAPSELKTSDNSAVGSVSLADGDWPEYRGPNRDGVVIGETLRTDWDARPPRLLWKHPIGLGWGSFAVIGRRAWTVEQRDANELVVCYDVETGRQLWAQSDAVRFTSVQGGDGPRSTPTVRDGRVFAQGATGILNCLDAELGQRVWSRNTLEDSGSTNLEWGQAGSPLIVGDLVIVNPGSNDAVSTAQQSSVIAYRCDNGEKVWAVEGRRGSYCSPHLAPILGERQVLIFDGPGIIALRPENGQRLWSFDWASGPQVSAAQPLIVDDRSVLIGCGYGIGSVLLTLSQRDGNWMATPVWKSKQFKLKFNSAVRHGNFAYGLDEGVLTCVNLLDGKRHWKQGRYGFGQMQLVGDQLLILAESGEVVIVPASPQAPRELARFPAIEGKTWNHPVLTRGRLIMRNSDEAACYDVR